MTQVDRVLFGVRQYLATLILGLIFVRVYFVIADFAPDSGPFTSILDTVEIVIPAVIGGYLLFVALYVIAGPIQRERNVGREVRRRR
jgi:hypothetical protein